MDRVVCVAYLVGDDGGHPTARRSGGVNVVEDRPALRVEYVEMQG